MEYSLLKLIVPNKSYYPISATAHASHFPSFDCVNPGIGNVASPYSYFVSSHFFSNPNLKTKFFSNDTKLDNEQEGGGKDVQKDKELNPEASSSILQKNTEDETEEILNELNAKKKKLLDQSIYESFLHPKKIKTEVLVLKKNNQSDRKKKYFA